ncbi:MAG: DEAD/DEAH box helicase family protein [Olegusella sp.]|nr:DEAD/DEAH box helicase family protein [Olegusella sp.]
MHDTGAVQLDVEMETGTGKTYVYTKTMFELNRRYGWTKFIVVVPSIAIREGVYKSLQATEQHFFEQYGRSLRFFVYNSDRLNDLDAYSQSSDVCAMIINMQAFNTSFNKDKNKDGRGGDKAARIIFDERDEFGSRKPIDVIAANRPIIIQDEPQKMGGRATQAGIKQFNPLFCLNYSATHRERHNMVYALDAVDAYNQRLVKRIEVKGFELKNMRGTDGYLYLQDILVSHSHAPVAVIEHNRMGAAGKISRKATRFDVGDSVYDASGDTRLEAYSGFQVSNIVPDMDGQTGYVEFLNGVRLDKGQVYGDSSGRDMRRVQIRETIKSHLDKEEALFAQGIKCLSLFFIDEVAKYRAYGEDGEELTVGYGRVFEEEYEREVGARLAGRMLDPAYRAYLSGISAHGTHKGYFSIDKKGHAVDSKVKRGSDESDDESAYDLILKNKERLLSLEEPVRFIFSHSALREGWDNPNIFQICTLKHSDNETGKRQEVGRGLRLCVNQDGDRQDASVLGERGVHEVNVLTVIASESYASFTAALQSDIRSELHDRPLKVDNAFFTGRTILVEYDSGAKEEVTFSEQESNHAYFALVQAGLVDMDGKPTDKFREQGITPAMPVLPEGLKSKAKAIETLVKSVYDPSVLDGMICNGHETKIAQNRLNDNYRKKEFQDLWTRINRKHAYTVEFDEVELRRKAIASIDANLTVSELTYSMTYGAQREHASRADLDAKAHFVTTGKHEEAVDVDATPGVAYDLLGEVAAAAAITRRSAAAILKGINQNKFALYRRNPEEFIAKVGRLIVEQKATMIVDHITYHEIEGTYDSGIFAEHMPKNASGAYEAKKNVQDYVFPDSDGERKFAEDLDLHDEVAVYAKLPRSFQIPTPVGNYAPDWAIAFRQGSVRHVFFVAETKGSMSTLDLKGVEKAKIECASKLFESMSTSDVRYHQVATYDDLLALVNGG